MGRIITTIVLPLAMAVLMWGAALKFPQLPPFWVDTLFYGGIAVVALVLAHEVWRWIVARISNVKIVGAGPSGDPTKPNLGIKVTPHAVGSQIDQVTIEGCEVGIEDSGKETSITRSHIKGAA